MTAHHANDQAETVLMKLIRGNYIASLSGIDVERNFYQGHLVRPLLNFDKPSIKQFAIDNQITWFEDATNKDLDVQRNRFRNVILPLMQQENKNAVEHIGQFTSELSDLKNTNEFLLRQNLNIISDDEGNITISKFLLYPNYVQKSLIAYLIFFS
ncbi:tRNA lysidine(34) synthetase TilS [Apilactobacillus ozensis]|uniref:tRNA lysidine(34) synthetase TilS n=1 Tax=Apilactobacillus ozensis TaxID=866801 RepID=UPI0006D0A19B|nr:tRNA lysidine(34) synthetase TilS [Apilactobacillus ozensis]